MPVDLAANPKLQTILSELRRRFEELYGNRLVRMILYGSQARGDARQWSDIDVLVVLKAPVRHGEEVERASAIVAGLSLEFDAVLQCFYVDEDRFWRSEEPVFDDIHREGVEL